jgi:hypothetical protein
VLLTKYYTGDHITEDEGGFACGGAGEKRNAYGVLAGKPEETIWKTWA